MPTFTIESARFVPEFRIRVFEAETVEQACRQAVDDPDWSDAKRSLDTPGETHVTGIWDGSTTDLNAPLLAVPSQFLEMLCRKAEHFEVLLGLLKILASDSEEAAQDIRYWRRRSAQAIAKAEAILAGARDPR